MSHPDKLQALQIEESMKERMGSVAALGRRMLAGTNLLQNPDIKDCDYAPITLVDIAAYQRFLLRAHAPTLETYWLHGHLSTVGSFAQKFAEKLKTLHPYNLMYQNLNPLEMAYLGYRHDFGRIFSHNPLEHEKIGDAVSKEIGERSDLIAKLHSPQDAADAIALMEEQQLTAEEAIALQLDQAPLEKKLLVMADMCGKRDKETWDITPYSEFLPIHIQRGKALKQKKDPNHRLFEVDTIRYENIKLWLADQGTNIEEVRQEILREEKELPIQAILFDYGNVLALNPNPQIYKSFAKELGLNEEVIKQAEAYAVEGMVTGAETEEVFWQKFSQALGKTLPANYKDLYTDPLRGPVNLDVLRIVQTLKSSTSNGADPYTLGVLTDTVPPHFNAIQASGGYSEFDEDNVVTSFQSGTSKKKPAAFFIAGIRLGYIPSGRILLVDDRPEYIELAQQKAGMKGIVYDVTQDSPEILVNQLRANGIRI